MKHNCTILCNFVTVFFLLVQVSASSFDVNQANGSVYSDSVNNSNMVDFYDFAGFAAHWLETDCNELNQWCIDADIDHSAIVDSEDLWILLEQWLRKFVTVQVNRESVAFDENVKLYPVDVPQTKKICVSSRSNLILPPSGANKPAFAVDGDKVLCVAQDPEGGNTKKLYSTFDGNTFVEELDMNDLPGHPSGVINSLAVANDGGWLLSVCKVEGPFGKGSLLYRKPQGGQWQKVLDIDIGWPAYFGWQGIRGNEICIVTYGDRYTEPYPTAVYYSGDNGQTWAKIFETDDPNIHGHTCIFRPEHTNSIYISYGDLPYSKIRKINYTLGAGGKSNPANWSEDSASPIYYAEPTSVVSDGRYLYWGHDATLGEATVYRMDPSDNTFKDLIGNRESVYSVNSPYRQYTNKAWAFSLKIIDGIFYASVHDEVNLFQNKRSPGIYVSADGEHWTCAWRGEYQVGPKCIAGKAGGYLWGWWVSNDGSGHLYRADLVKAVTVDATQIERGISNILNADQSYFAKGLGNWRLANQSPGGEDCNALIWTDEEAIYGTHSLKIVGHDNQAGHIYVYPKIDVNLPQVGDYVMASVWFKTSPSTPPEARPDLVIGSIPAGAVSYQYSIGRAVFQKGWQRLMVWSRCVEPVTSVLPTVRIHTDLVKDAGEDISEIVFYLDAAQWINLSDMHNSTNWQPGDVPRADEFGTAPLDMDNNWSAAFVWRPEGSNRELHSNIPIATWLGANGSYISLYFNPNEYKIALTNGTATVLSEAVWWEWFDTLKFVITSNGNDSMLYIETTLRGYQTPLNGTGIKLTDRPVMMLFNSNHDRSVIGRGLFTLVQTWNRVLDSEAARQIFDQPWK